MTTKKIHLSLKAINLANVATGWRKISHPYASVSLSLSTKLDADRKVLGKTEVLNSCLSPDWVKTFTINHDPNGEIYFVTVEILDFKNNDKAMGIATFQLSSVMEADCNSRSFKLPGDGILYVRAEEAIGSGTFVLKMSGEKLKNTEGIFRRSDPFYQFVRSDVVERGPEWNIVHRSHPIMNNLSPDWPEEKIELSELCYSDINRRLQLSIYDYEKNGEHVFMGGIETSVLELVNKFKSEQFVLEITKKKKKTGKLILHWAEIIYD